LLAKLKVDSYVKGAFASALFLRNRFVFPFGGGLHGLVYCGIISFIQYVHAHQPANWQRSTARIDRGEDEEENEENEKNEVEERGRGERPCKSQSLLLHR